MCFSYRGNADAAAATAGEIEALGRKGLAVQADVTQPESAEELVKAALDAFGKVDILVNNAGITRDDLIMRMKPEDWRDVLETNLFGAFWTLEGRHPPDAARQVRPDHQHHFRVRARPARWVRPTTRRPRPA